ncbi:hypothetical protein WJX72_008912 [[Myrmecia] bisecta]|uniref:CSC1/OSCA1-like cytosolic domain-containing protein n=1 Tax=[Myrmecia] bisecta TaxID=41462 RepID=A0AAW1Q6V3_9CHLO
MPTLFPKRVRRSNSVRDEPDEPDGSNLDDDEAQLLDNLGPWEPPREDMAKYAFVRQHYHHELFDLRDTSTDDLAEFGSGMALYFYLLKWLGMLFTALTVVCAVPNIVYNIMGGYYDKGNLETTSLGNFGGMWASTSYVLDPSIGKSSVPSNTTAPIIEKFWRSAPDDAGRMPIPFFGTPYKRDVNFAMSILDLGACLLYFLATLAMAVRQKQVMRDLAKKTVTIGNYSVLVKALPTDTEEAELHAHFQQYGPLVGVEIARNDSDLITLALERGEVAKKLDAALASARQAAHNRKDTTAAISEADHWRKQLLSMNDATQRMQLLRGEAACVCAFITFKDEEGRVKCLRANPDSSGQRFFQRKDKKFRKRWALVVKPAPEPSDILWENLEFTPADQHVRGMFTFFANYTLLAIGFFLVNLATSARNASAARLTNPPGCDTSCGYFDASNHLYWSAADQAKYLACSTTGKAPDGSLCTPMQRACYRCFCNVATLNAKFGFHGYCPNLMREYPSQLGLMVGAIVVTNVINIVLSTTAIRTTSYERHHTLSAEQRSLAAKLFVAQFINTAFSSMVANMALPPLRALFSHIPWLSGVLFQGVLGDMIPQWYALIGRAAIFNIILMGVSKAGFVAYRAGWYRYQLRGRTACVTQTQLNAAYEGPAFALADRYGELLNIVFCTMLFAAGLPVLYPIAALIFIAAYWCEKWELLKLSKIPPQYTNDLAELTGNLLPWAAVWHLGFAAWAYSFFKSFQAPPIRDGVIFHVVDGLGTAVNAVLFGTSKDNDKGIGWRCLQKNAAHHTLAFFSVLVLIALRLSMNLWLKALSGLGSLVGLGSASSAITTRGLPSFAIALRSRLLVGPSSYSMKANAKYTHALTANTAWADSEDGGPMPLLATRSPPMTPVPKAVRKRRKLKPEIEVVVEDDEIEEQGQDTSDLPSPEEEPTLDPNPPKGKKARADGAKPQVTRGKPAKAREATKA